MKYLYSMVQVEVEEKPSHTIHQILCYIYWNYTSFESSGDKNPVMSSCAILLKIVFSVLCFLCVCEDEILHLNSEDVSEEAASMLSSYLENNSVDSLPVHSRDVRPISCGEGVEEELILYR